MKNKKSRSQKSRRRKTATKPSGVSSKKATKGSVPPSKRRKTKRKKSFKVQIEKLYRTSRSRWIRTLRAKGVRDAEAAFHSAILTILRACSEKAKDIAYLPNRLKGRIINAQAFQYRRQNREQDVPDAFWFGLQANDAPASTRDLEVELAYLFERLDAYSSQILRWFYLDHRSIDEISALTGKPEGTIKNQLFRARKKARKILVPFRASDEEACNRPDPSEG
jgi:RNA polymerase sigma factor (sigma-70 family)